MKDFETVPAISETTVGQSNSHNISENTFHRLRDLIVRCKLAPGSRVIEADIADRLGVSRTPIRTALHRLRQEGYIMVTAGTGNKARLAISPLTQFDAQELYQILGHLEGLAARSAAQMEPARRAALVGKLQEFNEGLREFAESGHAEPNRTFDLDMNFHQAIVDTSAGPRLRGIHAATKPQVERYWRLYSSAMVDRLDISVGEHMAILESIQRGDADSAERAMQTTWRNGSQRLARVIESLGERGSWLTSAH